MTSSNQHNINKKMIGNLFGNGYYNKYKGGKIKRFSFLLYNMVMLFLSIIAWQSLPGLNLYHASMIAIIMFSFIITKVGDCISWFMGDDLYQSMMVKLENLQNLKNSIKEMEDLIKPPR